MKACVGDMVVENSFDCSAIVIALNTATIFATQLKNMGKDRAVFVHSTGSEKPN